MGVMFQIKDGTISLNKTKTLSPKQLNQLNRLTDSGSKTSYLLSIMGLTKKNKVWIDRLKSTNIDELANKRSNSVFKKMEYLRDVNTDHYPATKDLGKWIGVEIECIIPRQDGDSGGDCTDECDHDNGECYSETNWSESQAHKWLRRQLIDAGVTRVCVKHDGSLEDSEGHGVECTILFNSSYGFDPLHKLCNALKKAGCYVNDSCGLHVHLDSRNLKPKQLKSIGNSIGHALPIIKWLVPEKRHKSTYCKLEVSGLRGDRYYAVNLTAFRRYKTIEVRLHSGSINPVKITNWINLLKLIGAAELKSDLESFQDLIDVPGVNQHLIEYMERRINKLNPNAWLKIMPGETSIWPRKVISPIDTTIQGVACV